MTWFLLFYILSYSGESVNTYVLNKYLTWDDCERAKAAILQAMNDAYTKEEQATYYLACFSPDGKVS